MSSAGNQFFPYFLWKTYYIFINGEIAKHFSASFNITIIKYICGKVTVRQSVSTNIYVILWFGVLYEPITGTGTLTLCLYSVSFSNSIEISVCYLFIPKRHGEEIQANQLTQGGGRRWSEGGGEGFRNVCEGGGRFTLNVTLKFRRRLLAWEPLRCRDQILSILRPAYLAKVMINSPTFIHYS